MVTRRSVRASAGAASSSISGGGSGSSSGGGAPVVHRSAGPPVDIMDTLTWTIISVIGYMCFLYLPNRLQRRAAVAFGAVSGLNDLAFAGSHLHFCIWLWPIYDYVLRFVQLCTMPFAAGLHRHYPVWATPRAVINAVRLAIGLRELPDAAVGEAASDASSAATASRQGFSAASTDHGGSNDDAGLLTHHHAVIAAALVMLVLWSVWVYVSHARYWLAKRQQRHLRPTRVGSKNDADAPDEAYRMPFSTCSMMVLWSLCFATAFAWVKAFPVLMRTLYPTCVLLLVGYLMLIP